MKADPRIWNTVDIIVWIGLPIAVLVFLWGCGAFGASTVVMSPRQATVAAVAGKPMSQSVPLATQQPITVNSNYSEASYGIGLAWDPPAGTNVAGYNVYFGSASRTYTNLTDVGDVTNVNVNCPYGQPIYYAVTAYNLLGLESAYSAEVEYGRWLDDRITVTGPTNAGTVLICSSSMQPMSKWSVATANFTGTFTTNTAMSVLFFRLRGRTNALQCYGWAVENSTNL
jgi:hypothetical protein